MSESVCLVIPVYNEEACIENVIRSWHQGLNFKKVPHEIIIINDGSKDNTGEILDYLSSEIKELKVIHQENGGHGNAITNGYYHAIRSDKDYIFQVDSDDQFLPQDFFLLWEKRTQSPFVIGIRRARKDHWSRKLISFTLSTLIFDFFDVDIYDANIPFRLFKREYLESLYYAIPRNNFAPNIFISIMAIKHLGKKTPQIPVHHIQRRTGTNSLVSLGLIKACFRSLFELFSFRYNLYQKINFIENSIHNRPVSIEVQKNQAA